MYYIVLNPFTIDTMCKSIKAAMKPAGSGVAS